MVTLIYYFRRVIARILISGNIYLIGGSTNVCQLGSSSRVVTRVSLIKGSISRIQPLLEPISGPTIASSQNMIAVCGGLSNGSPASTCQLYSIAEDAYVTCINLLSLSSTHASLAACLSLIAAFAKVNSSARDADCL